MKWEPSVDLARNDPVLYSEIIYKKIIHNYGEIRLPGPAIGRGLDIMLPEIRPVHRK